MNEIKQINSKTKKSTIKVIPNDAYQMYYQLELDFVIP